MRINRMILISMFLLTSCSTTSVITDKISTDVPPVIEKKNGNQIIEYRYDAMVRRGNEYADGNKLVLDSNYYQQNAFRRGDIIYFQTPSNSTVKEPKENIARIDAPMLIRSFLRPDRYSRHNS
ncbi:hypothetical protein ACFPYJ_02585 [Paenibacillus solisilvae]|uniref:DUF3221 domain-containing protein n=1 Tax=Paenibacillus solisilvae TaxID=2486751 RepID=A0ABW0VR22_9BACL